MRVQMQFEKETKNTYRFREVAPEGQEVLGTIYIRKTLFKDGIPTAPIDVEIPSLKVTTKKNGGSKL